MPEISESVNVRSVPAANHIVPLSLAVFSVIVQFFMFTTEYAPYTAEALAVLFPETVTFSRTTSVLRMATVPL